MGEKLFHEPPAHGHKTTREGMKTQGDVNEGKERKKI